MAVAVAVGAGLLVLSGPSTADVSAVRGSAYGYFSSVSLFGGPAMTRGPAPTIALPPGGTNSVPNAIIQYGPAILFSSDQITVSSTGTTGPSGSVTSTATINNINKSTTQPTLTGSEVFTADQLSSTCTASESGVSGSTTVVNGTVRTSEGDPNVDGDEVYASVPTNPPPNYTIQGVIEGVGDRFEEIFNEQIINPDGSITVYAAHLRLLGPTAVGDLYLGRVDCGVSVVAGTTTTSTTASSTTTIPTTTSSSTATTRPTSTTSTSTTTSTMPTTTTTTRPTSTTSSSTTTTTRVPTGPAGPTDKDQCKDGGWRQFGFKNQGQCVSFVNHLQHD
ncbi:MAG: hypothetical protein M3326_05290 [Actinomycetota bacterium]|nr:hypothetical protein [Actinomycetota bacterium]